MFNDRNLTIFAISVLVVAYMVWGGDTATDKGDIVEKAIIALGSLATGSIMGNRSSVKDIFKKNPPENLETQKIAKPKNYQKEA